MNDAGSKLSGPDLTKGVAAAMLADRAMLQGHAHGEPVLLIRRGDEFFAIGANCTHYGAPLADGLLVDEVVRCPWHHACFSVRTGEALRAPALDPVSRWHLDVIDEPAHPSADTVATKTIYVREKLNTFEQPPLAVAPDDPASVVIIGGGAAGNAAAETLRQEGYHGRVTILSADESLPCDRPNLSKGYLAGTASMESNFLRPTAFYVQHDIDVFLGARVVLIDTANAQVELENGIRHDYGALLIATGAEPIRLDVPGSDQPHVHYLRTVADSQAIGAHASSARRAIVIGASFIGLEVAAALRMRNITVHVVGRERIPMERILGAEVGDFIRDLHEEHGVIFHLGTTVTSISERSVTLENGELLEADIVVVGIGVRPMTSLAERAGLTVDRGVKVDEYLETSRPRIFAAGDIARWPDHFSGEQIRVEHFVVAERQGQTAARNILGQKVIFDAIPFFWTEQYDFGLAYVGHAEHWDTVTIDGDLTARDCTIQYRQADREMAVAVIHRDLEGVRTEVKFEAMARKRVKIEKAD